MQKFKAGIIIDATGDGDVAALAGVPFYKGREKDGLMQPATVFVLLGGIDDKTEDVFLWKGNKNIISKMKQEVGNGNIPFPAGAVNIMPGKQKGTALLNMTSSINVDGTKSEDMTRAEFECREQIPPIINFLRKNAPGYEDCYVIRTSSTIGIRETRHLQGKDYITEQDLLKGRIFEDWVVTGVRYPFDIHSMSGIGQDESEPGEKVKTYTIPYGCFISEKVSNLLFTGRCISGSHMAHSSFRMMPTCFAMGQATGTAAALCVKNNLLPTNMDVGLLQNVLLQQGVDKPNG